MKGAGLLGLLLFCPSALALAGVGWLAGKIAGEDYRQTVCEADRMLGKRYGGGRGAVEAAEVTSSFGEALAPWTFGVTAAWMAYNAKRLRDRMGDVAPSPCDGSFGHSGAASASGGPMARTYSASRF
jgi:hypothetical protein